MSERRAIDDEFLAGVVRQYEEHVEAGRMPAPAISDAEGVPVRTVHRWVYEARKRGMLPPGTPPGLCGGKVTPKPLGAAGQNVRRNISRLRSERRFTYVELAEKLAVAGRPIPVLGLRRLAAGERRVDVDDLVALAAVFGVEPAFLMNEPPPCTTCHGTPPPGFACTGCDATTPKEG